MRCRILEPGRKESQHFQKVVPDVFGLEASELASLGANRLHGNPPLIGLGVHRRSGEGRAQTFAISRFRFGRALRPLHHADLRSDLSACLWTDCTGVPPPHPASSAYSSLTPCTRARVQDVHSLFNVFL